MRTSLLLRLFRRLAWWWRSGFYPRRDFRRAVCGRFGHAWVEASKEPVISAFLLCTRCGKWTARSR